MSSVSIDVDVSAVRAQFADLADNQMPFLVASAITATMGDVREAEIAEMQDVFDRPTDWTLNSLEVHTANKNDTPIEGSVAFKTWGGTPATKFLAAEVEGGPRNLKSFEKHLQSAGIMEGYEFAVPGNGVDLDANGNMSGSLIESILSDLGAAENAAGYQANVTKRSRKRHAQRSTYFVLRRDHGGGIYRRDAGSRAIVSIIAFVSPPSYTERFPLYDKASETVAEALPRHLAENYASIQGGAWKAR